MSLQVDSSSYPVAAVHAGGRIGRKTTARRAIRVRVASTTRSASEPVRVGLIVAFAGQTESERRAVELAWTAATDAATRWTPTFAVWGVAPVSPRGKPADLLVYLGESSRFAEVAGFLSARVPTILVKSTIEELLDRRPRTARRYRMCTGVQGIARALAAAAPKVPTVDWTMVPWPPELQSLIQLDEGERLYVQKSTSNFREAALARGIQWVTSLPTRERPFSVFLTMHDPTAARLAAAACRLWPQCTVLAADGMVSTVMPDTEPWPDRAIRVRHWTPHSRSAANRAFRDAIGGQLLPDYDSAGMLFGTLHFLDRVLASGGSPARLEEGPSQPGPVGPMQLTAAGRPRPERLVLFWGEESKVITLT